MIIPKFSKDLIEELSKIYDELRLTPDLTIEEIMFKSGKRELVKELIEDLKYQEEGDDSQ